MIPLRDEDPIPSFPGFTLGLIVLNLSVFLYEIRLPADQMRTLIATFGATPFELTHFTHLGGERWFPNALSLISSQYLHGGWLHLLGNMLYLWTFGMRVEDDTGHIQFPLFYTLCGVGAGLTQVVMTPESKIPMVGASGAVAGILGVYLIRFPFHRVRVLVPILFFFRILLTPAWIFLGIWFLFQWYSAGSETGVAWYAHIGGFLTGICLSPFFPHRKRARRTIH